MNTFFMDGRAVKASKLLAVAAERTRRISLPEEYDPDEKFDGWSRSSGSVWMKVFKSARALRVPEPPGPSWSKVIHYRAEDHCTGEVIYDLNVVNVESSDPRLRARLKEPCDLKVVLTVATDETCETVASVGGSLATPPRTTTTPSCSSPATDGACFTLSSFHPSYAELVYESSALAFGSSACDC